jgi:hypothetical protein
LSTTSFVSAMTASRPVRLGRLHLRRTYIKIQPAGRVTLYSA